MLEGKQSKVSTCDVLLYISKIFFLNASEDQAVMESNVLKEITKKVGVNLLFLNNGLLGSSTCKKCVKEKNDVTYQYICNVTQN